MLMRLHLRIPAGTEVEEIVNVIHATLTTVENTEFDYDDAFQWKALYLDEEDMTRTLVHVNLYLLQKEEYLVEVHRLHGDTKGERCIFAALREAFFPGTVPSGPSSSKRLEAQQPIDAALLHRQLLMGGVLRDTALFVLSQQQQQQQQQLFRDLGITDFMATWLEETPDRFDTRALKRRVETFLRADKNFFS